MRIATQERLFALPQHEITSDDCYTPAWVFDGMGIEFDLDVCAPPGGIPWIPAKRHYTQEDDGLAAPWFGVVWMNPPYSNCTPWAQRFKNHGNGVCLVQASKGRWCSELVAASDALLYWGDIRFHDARGGDGAIYMPVMFLAIGACGVGALRSLGGRAVMSRGEVA